MNSMSFHDVMSITIEPMTMVNGSAWRNVVIKSKPCVRNAETDEFAPALVEYRIALHCADEVRPIDIKVKS